ncbi:MAG: hypothetical protein CM1200mP2_27060 [Planctomycetaceae bacterium]|nr:MAG: hypothetical protein CM1200mP2_27060 [Planctomycetaceae bacterium]
MLRPELRSQFIQRQHVQVIVPQMSKPVALARLPDIEEGQERGTRILGGVTDDKRFRFFLAQHRVHPLPISRLATIGNSAGRWTPPRSYPRALFYVEHRLTQGRQIT